MALGAVSARIEGDVFQGMFFWLQAARLLQKDSKVARVSIEHDQAAGVDDVSVRYVAPGIDAGGRDCAADYFQVKYHVDRRSEYEAMAFCDPNFINSKRSLLQRFHAARKNLGDGNGWYRLHLVSNWQWSASDNLGPLLRESAEGALPDRFFTDSSRSALGTIREAWKDHIGLSDADFEDFARRLRLGVDYLTRPMLREWLNDRFVAVGLKPIPIDRTQNIYDSLTQQIIMNGTNEFDSQSFRAFCKRENLLVDPPTSGPKVYGIRSFMRFAEYMEDECNSFVCVAKNFEGRHIRSPEYWQSIVRPTVVSFLKDKSSALRADENHLLLDCHCSVAFLAGYELDRKSGAQVYPVQKGVRKAVWKPEFSGITSNSDWNVTTSTNIGIGDDVAVVVSVSRDALGDAKKYVDSVQSICTIVDARPVSGIGSSSITGADHAVALADALAEVFRTHRPKNRGMIHLFLSVPNALAFFLGQHRGALGKVQLYEFDFEGERTGSYTPSIYLPAL